MDSTEYSIFFFTDDLIVKEGSLTGVTVSIYLSMCAYALEVHSMSRI
jgi:hypothetical protein